MVYHLTFFNRKKKEAVTTVQRTQKYELLFEKF